MPTSSVHEVQLLHVLTDADVAGLLILAILNEWYLIMVLVSGPPATNSGKPMHIFC